jgi:hypothetical protein
MKRALLIVLVAGVAFAGAVLFVSNRQTARRSAEQAALQKATANRAAEPEQARKPGPRAATPVVVPVPPGSAPPEKNTVAAASPPMDGRAAPAAPAAKAKAAPRAKPELKDPLARVALSFVGADADAEDYWAGAINDPTLSAHEREDLIEDLNEEGFPDPKNLTAEDLPLILSRIVLIEDYVFDAMDEVNAAAFLEAYKDLVNMYARLTQR